MGNLCNQSYCFVGFSDARMIQPQFQRGNILDHVKSKSKDVQEILEAWLFDKTAINRHRETNSPLHTIPPLQKKCHPSMEGNKQHRTCNFQQCADRIHRTVLDKQTRKKKLIKEASRRHFPRLEGKPRYTISPHVLMMLSSQAINHPQENSQIQRTQESNIFSATGFCSAKDFRSQENQLLKNFWRASMYVEDSPSRQ